MCARIVRIYNLGFKRLNEMHNFNLKPVTYEALQTPPTTRLHKTVTNTAIATNQTHYQQTGKSILLQAYLLILTKYLFDCLEHRIIV